MKRNILLNPGPATTTDTVKLAQVVPDICPREKEFGDIMRTLSMDLVKIVHGSLERYAAVLFCGSGTLNMDVCLNSLLPEGRKILIINNGAYSARAVEICRYYGLEHIVLNFSVDTLPRLETVRQTLEEHPEIDLVYATHHETGTGLLNPIREIGALAHEYQAVFVVDTTSTLAIRPINIQEDHIDFCMASAQKGIQAMTGLSFIIGRKDLIEASQVYPKRSYYCNLYLQYAYFCKTGQMHFTPPVQVIYAVRQALREYFSEGEQAKWERHQRVNRAIHAGACRLGFKEVIRPEYQAGIVVSLYYPKDPCWNFELVHDDCYVHGFTIYPGKIAGEETFRLCALGAIDEVDIHDFFQVFEQALRKLHVTLPVKY